MKYIVENKNGKNQYSCNFQINDIIDVIRINILNPVYQRNYINDIVKSISHKGKDILFDNSINTVFSYCTTLYHIKFNEYVENSNDLKIELFEKCKIEIMLLQKQTSLLPKNLLAKL